MAHWYDLASQFSLADVPFPNAVSVVGTYTVDATNGAWTPEGLFDWHGSGGNCALNLPAISGTYEPGRILVIRKVDSGTYTMTITPNGADTINGAATLQLYSQYETVILQNDGPAGADWAVTSHTGAPSTATASTQLGTAKAAASVNLTLSGTQTVDTIGLSVGDICLATAQTTAKDRGPYVVSAGAWTRPSWYATGAVITPGGYVVVDRGAQNGPSLWLMKGSTNVTVDTSSSTWVQPTVNLASLSQGGATGGQVLESVAGAWTPTDRDPRVYLLTATVTSTTAITLTGTPTIDGVGTVVGTIINCVNQAGTGSPPYAAHVDNGPWQVMGSGSTPMQRPAGYSVGSGVLEGSLVFTKEGTATTGQYQSSWDMVSGSAIIGTDPTMWARVLTSLQNGVVGTLPVANGGTGAATLTAHGLLIGEGTSPVAAMSAGSSGQIPRSGGASADPTWSTATYPATAGTSGNVLTSDGTNFVSQAPAGGSGINPTDYISGLYLSWVSNTQFNVNTGSAYSANGAALITVTSGFNVTPTISASTKYYVYLLTSSTVSVSTTAPTLYQGTAAEDGSNNRYLGMFLTDASSHIYNFQRVGDEVRYKVDTTTAPFNISLTSATSSTSQSLSAVVPTTAIRALVIAEAAGSNVYFGSSTGFTPTTGSGESVSKAAAWTPLSLNLNASQAILFCNAASAGTPLLNVLGYLEPR